MNKLHKEETKKSLALAKSMLNEMAMSLEDFKDRVLHLQFRLVENWCLCKWCQLFDINNDNFYHWLVEFKAYAMALQRIKLKSGDKKKTLCTELIENYDYNDPNSILEIIVEKFADERINDASQQMKVSIAFSEGITRLIDAICSTTSLTAYIRKEFGLDNANEA